MGTAKNLAKAHTSIVEEGKEIFFLLAAYWSFTFSPEFFIEDMPKHTILEILLGKDTTYSSLISFSLEYVRNHSYISNF